MQTGDHHTRVALFDRVYEQHHRAVYAYLLGRTNDAPTAMDLLQETFLKVWSHMERAQELDDEQRRFWLFRIAKNVVIGHYRRQQSRRNLIEKIQMSEEGLPRQIADPHDAYASKETVREVDEAIRRLPELIRVPLVMQVMGEMTSTQIGEILDRPPGTVRYQISRARKQLERELKSQHRVVEAH